MEYTAWEPPRCLLLWLLQLQSKREESAAKHLLFIFTHQQREVNTNAGRLWIVFHMFLYLILTLPLEQRLQCLPLQLRKFVVEVIGVRLLVH